MMSGPAFLDRHPSLREQKKPGLRAMGSNSKKVKERKPPFIKGSINLDSALNNGNDKAEGNAHRWDYLLWAAGQGAEQAQHFYIEVHDASATSAIKEILKKAQWLEDFLQKHQTAADTKGVTVKKIWVASGKSAFKASDQGLKTLATKQVRFVGSMYDFT